MLMGPARGYSLPDYRSDSQQRANHHTQTSIDPEVLDWVDWLSS
jgi:hypothetical protein